MENMKTKLVPLNSIKKLKQVFKLSDKIKSVMLIDDDKIANFVNHKTLEDFGISDVTSFMSVNRAIAHLKKTKVKYQLILLDINLPVEDGFDFIEKFYALKLDKKQGKICILSSSDNPSDKKKAADRNINFIEKPLIIENLLINL
jgi:CheY-like chemotaxis protein